jgi:hypothetical protein
MVESHAQERASEWAAAWEAAVADLEHTEDSLDDASLDATPEAQVYRVALHRRAARGHERLADLLAEGFTRELDG